MRLDRSVKDTMVTQPYTTSELREAYLTFFEQKGCERYASASLVPKNDPTTLFTVAGMAQFKDMFLGRGNLPFKRCTRPEVYADQ